MITPPPGVRVYLACGYTDMLNYAECIVMLSRSRQCLSCRDILAEALGIIIGLLARLAAWPVACRAVGSVPV
jgi:hypothetical protein